MGGVYSDGVPEQAHRRGIFGRVSEADMRVLSRHVPCPGQGGVRPGNENEAFEGSPRITVTRLIEENDIVVAEGTVEARKRGGEPLNLRFCDVFTMQAGKIRHLVSYLMEVRA